jgi:hypothetical protein
MPDEQIGYKNPVLTFQVYEQVAPRRFVDEEPIWNVMWFADEPDERGPRSTDDQGTGWHPGRRTNA